MGSRPIRRAKSSRSPRLSTGPLVLALPRKTFKPPQAKIPPLNQFTTACIPSNYNKNCVEGYIRTFQACWLRWWPLFDHSNHGCGATTQNVPSFPIFKIPLSASSPPFDRPLLGSDTLWKGISRPICGAKSSSGLCLTLWPLVLVLKGKTFKSLPAKIRLQQLSPCPKPITTYSQDSIEDCS